MLRYAVGPSGGLTYHLKALRHQNGRWKPFRARVRDFLMNTWAPTEKELIVFGPSAGWTLPVDWLARFERVVFVEPDPVARFLLKRKFPRAGIESSVEYLPWFDEGSRNFKGRSRFADLVARNPNSAILFANVLGQIKLLKTVDENVDRDCRREFSAALLGRNWASYHDVLSSKAPLKSPFPSSPPRERDLDSLARHYFETDNRRQELVDHETLWIDDGRTFEFAPWTLDSSSNHLIGFVSPKKP
jgi:hypothetical protein